jgi:excinuclease ABC subunit A
VAQGTPEEIAKVARSYTGQYLKPLLKGRAAEKAMPAKKLRAAE